MKLELLPPEPQPKAVEKRSAGTRWVKSDRKFTTYVKPMLAKLHDEAFDSPDWIYEIKWDGYRAVAEIKGREVKLYSRNGLSFEASYPVVFEELKKIKTQVILDGEIVALDKDGKPGFQLLQHYGEDNSIPLCYYVFDCLSVGGKSIESKPLLERKKILQELLPESDIIRYSDQVEGKGIDFFKLTKQQGLEGMMAKKADGVYRENFRSSDWLKVKNLHTEEAVIAGYTKGTGGRKYFGALVLGIYKRGKLVYIGHTGTGFDAKMLKELHTKMQPLVVSKSPFDTDVPVNGEVTWVKPELVCNLKYSEVTEDGHRRHPVFMGLRIDKAAREVHEEVTENKETGEQTPAKTNPRMAKSVKTNDKVAFTHLDKVFWPEEGYTKGDVVDYYNAIYPHIIPYLKGRPESLLRMPDGIKGNAFFHKDAAGAAPDWVKSISLYSESAEKDIHYIICNDKNTLLYMANLGCIEINPWNSKVKSLEFPDYLVLDLDPSDDNTFEQVIETARVIKDLLDKAGAASFPKTSGATGIHIYVPLNAKYTYDQAKEFAHMIAVMAQRQLPDYTSLERNLAKRGKHNIYIDFLQNRKGQTLASAYSLRPKKGATVSTPLEWKEVKPGLHPSDFTFQNIIKRVETKGDLFTGVLQKGINMIKCIKNLGG